jgi:hypothetical protein
MFKNVYWSSCKLPSILARFSRNFNFLDIFSKNTQISNFMKIRPVGAALFHTDRQTGTAEANSRFNSIFRTRLKKHTLSNPDTAPPAPHPHTASIKVCEQKCLSNGISKYMRAPTYRDKFRWTYSGAISGFHCILLTDTSIIGEPRSAHLKAVLQYSNRLPNIPRVTKCMHCVTFLSSPRQPSGLGKGYIGNKMFFFPFSSKNFVQAIFRSHKHLVGDDQLHRSCEKWSRKRGISYI